MIYQWFGVTPSVMQSYFSNCGMLWVTTTASLHEQMGNVVYLLSPTELTGSGSLVHLQFFMWMLVWFEVIWCPINSANWQRFFPGCQYHVLVVPAPQHFEAWFGSTSPYNWYLTKEIGRYLMIHTYLKLCCPFSNWRSCPQVVALHDLQLIHDWFTTHFEFLFFYNSSIWAS